MSTEYSASAFYGTFVPRDSEAGEILARFIEHGTPGRTDAPEIVIDEVGSQPTGETFIVVRHKVEHSASRLGDQPRAPVLLRKPESDGCLIAVWLDGRGINPEKLPPIGWYFAASCG